MRLTRQYFCCLLASGYFLTPSAFAQEEITWLEDDGAVVIEIESAPIQDGWTLDTSISGFSGDGFYRWDGANHFRERDAGEGTLRFNFTIEEAGNYQLSLRSRIAVGEMNTEHNDSWVRLLGGSDIPEEEPLDGWTKAFMNQLGSWSWQTKTVDFVGLPIRQHFEAGTHAVEISGRSAGHAIDRFAVFRYEDIGTSFSRLNNLPLSQSIPLSDVSEPSMGDEEDTTEEGDSNTDTSTEDNTGDTAEESTVETEEETQNEEPPMIETVNVMELIEDDELRELAAGTCEANTIELAPVFDLHESASELVNGEELVLSGTDGRAFLLFDLTGLPAFNSASLRYTTTEAGSGEVGFYLGSHSDWTPDTLADAKPDAMLALTAAITDWQADTRYESHIDTQLMANGLLTLILQNAPGDNFQLAATERYGDEPRLRLSGSDGFCVAYEALKLSPVPESPDDREVIDENADSDELSTDTDADGDLTDAVDTPEASTGGSGGGGSLWFGLLAAIGLTALRRRRR